MTGPEIETLVPLAPQDAEIAAYDALRRRTDHMARVVPMLRLVRGGAQHIAEEGPR